MIAVFVGVPPSVQSTYSSAWTTESQSYCRTSCAVSSNYYYEAVQVRVSTSGTFSLISKSSIDTYGYLYNSSFNPLSPSSNLIVQDDDGAGNGQFNLKTFLESRLIYILVATTFDPRKIGSFSVSASGSGSVTFSASFV
jgi:hypothetical protein